MSMKLHLKINFLLFIGQGVNHRPSILIEPIFFAKFSRSLQLALLTSFIF